MVCPYCSAENAEDEIFCSECGLLLKKCEKKKKEISHNKYRKEGNNICYLSGASITEEEGLKDAVWFPNGQQYIGGKYDLIFYASQGITLSDYLRQNPESPEPLIRDLFERILYILNEIQRKKFLIGSCDPDDFFLVDGNPERMVYRVVRPLISLEADCLPQDYECGEMAAPEIRNNNADKIKKSTDVYLAALIFSRMLIGERYIAGDIESQLFWAYNYTSSVFGKKYREYHCWLGRCLSMFPGRRERNIKTCIRSFKECYTADICSATGALIVKDALKTDVGEGKEILMRSAGRDKSEWNEDVIEKWEDADKGIYAYLLADGISSCDIGSGYIASNIIREKFVSVLEENINEDFEDFTYDMAEHLAHQIVELSNAAIREEALKYRKTKGSIMGSTFIFAVIHDGWLYYYSLGDSLLYLLRNGNMIPLNSPDNAGFAALKNGKSFTEYRQMEGKDNITVYVGGEYAETGSGYFSERRVGTEELKVGDIIIASSDGVVDYYGTEIYDTKWGNETVLAEKLSDWKKTPEQRAQAVINRDNNNGGGDNLSLILIEIGGVKNHGRI